ncbi:MAG: hypothetical protein ABIO83_09755 [Ilumatobacteraceae bacterium]
MLHRSVRRSVRRSGLMTMMGLVVITSSCADDGVVAPPSVAEVTTGAPSSPPSTITSTTTTTSTSTGTVARSATTPSTITRTITSTITSATVPDVSAPALDLTDPTAVVPDRMTCDPEWHDLESSDEVTFARDGGIFTFDPTTGEVSCLAAIDDPVTTLDWNPVGDRLLVDGDTVLSADGAHPAGFAPATAGITWSQPAGSALLAPTPDGSQLLHVDADDPTDVEHVGALATTWAAAYHPSGLAILVAGIADDGSAGLFITDNLGGQLHQFVFLEDADSVITDLAVAHNGNWVTFVHDHIGSRDRVDPAAAHVHRFDLTTFGITDIEILPDDVPTALIASDQRDGTVAWERDIEGGTGRHVAFTWSGGVPNPIAVDDHDTDAVGFLDDGTVATLVRPSDSPRAAADLVLVSLLGDRPVLIAHDVTAAATRTIHHPNWSEPPLGIEQRAVG